mgnify:FL=1|jgi:hypothetical protein
MSRTKRNAYLNPLINKDGSITPRPCTNTDFAVVYGVNRRTFATWLKPFKAEIGERKSYFYTQAQVEIVFKRIGTPQHFDFYKYDMVA